MQTIEYPNEYDVIIVGSGAGGGMATKILSEAGLKIAVLEAGPYFDPKNPEHQTHSASSSTLALQRANA